jgi:hypothetical protein
LDAQAGCSNTRIMRTTREWIKSNPDAVKEVTDKFNSLDNEEEEDDLLADAAKNCNI